MSSTTPVAVQQLAYVLLTSGDVEGWQRLAAAIGLQQAGPAGEDGGIDLRLDDRPSRIRIVPGVVPGHIAGWEVASHADFVAMTERLHAVGVDVVPAPELALDRGMTAVATFVDPLGLHGELCWGPLPVIRSPFVSPTQTRFRTGLMGFGHLTHSVPDLAAARRFYCDVLGMRISDQGIIGGPIAFLRCNPRHHTMAFLERRADDAPSLRHLMLEVDTLDDLGLVRDRLLSAGATVTRDLGRHPTDGVVSIYVSTPDGFDLEVGWGSFVVDEQTWDAVRAARTTRPWGHRPPLTAIEVAAGIGVDPAAARRDPARPALTPVPRSAAQGT